MQLHQGQVTIARFACDRHRGVQTPSGAHGDRRPGEFPRGGPPGAPGRAGDGELDQRGRTSLRRADQTRLGVGTGNSDDVSPEGCGKPLALKADGQITFGLSLRLFRSATVCIRNRRGQCVARALRLGHRRAVSIQQSEACFRAVELKLCVLTASPEATAFKSRSSSRRSGCAQLAFSQ